MWYWIKNNTVGNVGKKIKREETDYKGIHFNRMSLWKSSMGIHDSKSLSIGIVQFRGPNEITQGKERRKTAVWGDDYKDEDIIGNF